MKPAYDAYMHVLRVTGLEALGFRGDFARCLRRACARGIWPAARRARLFHMCHGFRTCCSRMCALAQACATHMRMSHQHQFTAVVAAVMTKRNTCSKYAVLFWR